MNDDILYDLDSMLRLDKGIPCGNGYISPKYECQVNGWSAPRRAIAPPPPKNKKRQSSIQKLKNYNKVTVPLAAGLGVAGLGVAGWMAHGMRGKISASMNPPDQATSGRSEPPPPPIYDQGKEA